VEGAALGDFGPCGATGLRRLNEMALMSGEVDAGAVALDGGITSRWQPLVSDDGTVLWSNVVA
jgi:hypothetical protein